MKITPELIKKYHLGTCTELERIAVEHWLLNDTDEDRLLPEYTLNRMEENIWESLDLPKKKDHPVISLYKRWPNYMAAACVVITLSGAALLVNSLGTMRPVVSIDNLNSDDSKTLQTSGLTITIMPNSKVKASTNFFESKGHIEFCGALKIENKSNKDIDMQFNSTCDHLPYRLQCQKNTTYYILQHSYKTADIYAIGANDLDLVALPLRHKVKKIFNI